MTETETTEQTDDDAQAVHDQADAEATEGQEQETGEQETEQETGETGDDSEISKVRREAAGYRRKLRDAEAERDKLAARISDYDRAEVERQVSGEGGLQQASDFWAAGVQLDDLRDDDGALDAEKIKAAMRNVLKDHPHWRHQRRVSFDVGARARPPESPPSFGEALKRAAS